MAEPIDLGQVFAESSEDAFWAIRGKAIQAYANVEQSLCMVFASLSGMPLDVAGIVFFKIVNAGTLYEILEKLMRKKHDATYSLFWNSFSRILRDNLSRKRNEIVHWNVANFIDEKGYAGLGLIPPNVYDYGPNTPPPITTAKLLEFIEKCGFCSRLAGMFHLVITAHPHAMKDPHFLRTWPGIFLQPVVYPPPLGHPLNPNPLAPGSPPPPSPV